MRSLDRIDDLLIEWESARLAGQPVQPAELCADFPEGRAELARRAALLQRFEASFGLAESTGPPGDSAATEVPAIPGCTIRGELGQGGMGVVYRAWQDQLERDVAVKVMRGDATMPEARARRFTMEARLLARLRHDHIVPVYEADFNLGQPYFVMELVRGGSLAQRMEQWGQDPRSAARLLEKVARAVHHAHEQGVLHRDLKPANILLDEQDRPLVSDFGIAKLYEVADESLPSAAHASGASASTATVTDVTMGTPPYMAPEQFKGPAMQVSRHTDIWALGVILYELLTGRRPFQADYPGGYARAVVEEAPPRPRTLNRRLDAGIEAIVLRCLAKAPEQRYQTAAALADDLARWLAGEAPYAESWPHRLKRWCRRHPVTAAACVLVALAGAAWPVIVYMRDPAQARSAAQRELAAGRSITLVRELGPPDDCVLVEGAHGVRISDEPDRPFFVSMHGTALVELWAKPPPAFRLHAEVRHELNNGVVGIYVEHRPFGPLWETATCYALTFSDLGPSATRIPLPDGSRGSPIELNFRRLEPHPMLGRWDPKQRLNEEIFHTPVPGAGGPGPWRKVMLGVSPQGMELSWAEHPDMAAPVVWVPRAAIDARAREIQIVAPELTGYAWRPAERGAIGLYVANCTASFRNVVLEPLPQGP
jgi:serine/threonine-protein kinase